MIGAVPEQKEKRAATRYDAIIATLVGFCALCVSGYTAYIQRQQVRAVVWPILYFDSSNAPTIHFTLANKGVGPALIRNAIVRVDGQPVKNWGKAMEKILGPGEYHGPESDMNGRVLAAGESLIPFEPFDSAGKPFTSGRTDSEWDKVNKGRDRVTVQICYCSTLGECWTLSAGGPTSSSTTTETRRCPTPSAISFQQ